MPVQTFGLTATIDLLVLVSGIALFVGGAALIVSGARMGREALARRVDFVRPPLENRATAILQEQAAPVTGFIRFELKGLPARLQREAVRRLAKLGVPAHYASSVINGMQLLSAAVAAIFALLMVSRFVVLSGSRVLPVAIALLLCIFGWFFPSLILRMLVKWHAMTVADGLPDALELLVICAEAGLALEDSIERTIGELKRSQPELAAELALTSADLKILPSRDQAFANLAERVDIPSVRSVVVTLSQTLRYGTPFAQALRVVAADMRTESLINLEDRANRLPALMTVPMMLFIMPAILLIVGGPAVLRLLDALFR